MVSRLKLHNMLVDIIDDEKRVFYQPPESQKLSYPCILYFGDNDNVRYANDSIYKSKDRYTITLIDRDPDSELPQKIRKLRYTSFDRQYKANSLYHYVFTIFI